MMPKLSPPISRSLAIALLVGLVVVAYLVVVQPVIDGWGEQGDEISHLESTLARYRQVARQRAPREAELAELKQQAAGEDGLLRGTNETLMAATIQNRVKALVESAQGELKSVQTLPAQSEGHLRRITVRSQISMTIDAAQRVFYDLEGGEPQLFLDNIDIRSLEESRRHRERGDNGMLEVHLDVYGYAQPQP
jgi:general secretion pathway protein M